MRMSLRTKLAVGCLLAVFSRADAQEPNFYPTLPIQQVQQQYYDQGQGKEVREGGLPIYPTENASEAVPSGNSEPAEDDCPNCLWNTGTPFTISGLILAEDSAYDFGGWTQLGLHTRSNGIFNNQPDRINLHQQYLYIEKVADGSDGFDVGGRFDVIYGIDGANTQSFGNPPGTFDFMNGFGNDPREAFAFPQLYGEVAYGDLAMKIGHFYTINGYETVTSTGNFFYSHAFTFNFSEPFTHTGALATYTGIEGLTVWGGGVLGSDSGFASVGNAGAFLGGAAYQLTENVKASYVTNVGDLGSVGNGYFGTALLDVTMLDGKLNWVLQNDVAKHDFSLTGNGDFDSVAIVNYLFYSLNDCWKVGSRGEWYRVDGVDYYDVTAGMNFSPTANLRIRPEYRYQWSPEAQAGNNVIGVPVNLGIFGVDMILTY